MDNVLNHGKGEEGNNKGGQCYWSLGKKMVTQSFLKRKVHLGDWAPTSLAKGSSAIKIIWESEGQASIKCSSITNPQKSNSCLGLWAMMPNKGDSPQTFWMWQLVLIAWYLLAIKQKSKHKPLISLLYFWLQKEKPCVCESDDY